jgi:hypothetical protein
MRILQLCCFTDLWHSIHEICSIDLKTGNDVLDLYDDFGKEFDLIVSAPPCTQFTKANSLSWVPFPELYIRIAKKCFDISILSGKFWLLENPPGRIEKFLPGLTKFRMLTWSDFRTNKEYIVYSNFLILSTGPRYGKPGSTNNLTKKQAEKWQPDFIADVERSLPCELVK